MRTELSFHDQFTLMTRSNCLSITHTHTLYTLHTTTSHFCLCLMIKVHIPFGVSLKNTEIARHKTIQCSPHHFPMTNFILDVSIQFSDALSHFDELQLPFAIYSIGFNVNIYPIPDDAESGNVLWDIQKTNSVYVKYEAFYLWMWHRNTSTQKIYL